MRSDIQYFLVCCALVVIIAVGLVYIGVLGHVS